MLLGEEWAQYASKRRPLRVTAPAGEQRSRYFLHLPYRYGVPTMIAAGMLHWFISQAIFIISVDMYRDGKREADADLTGLNYSPLAILLTILLGFCMMLVLVGMGFRRYEGAIPLASNDSIAISAACHGPETDNDAAILPVMWGVVSGSLDNDDDVGHCCFTSEEV